MISEPVTMSPAEEWAAEWAERVRRVAPEQLSFDQGRPTSYWASPESARVWKTRTGFGRWPAVLLDTFLVLIAELFLNLILAVLALFVIAIDGGYLGHGASVNTALSHASNTATSWLTSPAGIACGALATQIGIVLVVYFRVIKRLGLSWSDLGIGATLGRAPVRAVGTGLLCGLLAFAVGEVLLNLMQVIGLNVSGQEKSFQSVRHASLAEVVPFVITTVFTAPLAEETFFRAYALRALTIRYGFPIALLVSSALFAALHLAGGVGWVVVPLFVVGLILGWSYARTGNLLSNVTAHALNNIIGVVLLYTSR